MAHDKCLGCRTLRFLRVRVRLNVTRNPMFAIIMYGRSIARRP
jgi:hypothetical protein